jgi:hypothetical protein
MPEAPTTADVAENAPALPPARICPNCGDSFARPAKGPGGHKRFCSDKCRSDWRGREKVQGAVIITLAKVWRKSRGSGDIGKAAFQRFVEALDILISDDEEAGRPKLTANGPVTPFLREIIEDRYLDRRPR